MALQVVLRGDCLVSASARNRLAGLLRLLDRGVIVVAALIAVSWIPTLVAALR